jgi:membrane-associated protein
MLDPVSIIESLGLSGVIAIVFAECGLFFGFFLPGDSLLFAAGLLSSQGLFSFPALLIFTMIAAILGENVGYAFGRKVGPMLFTREESRFFKPKHLARAHEFFVRHGKKAVFLARFLPIVRTFVPIVAGIAKMPFGSFMAYNLIGALVWVGSMTTLGYVLGNQVANADHYLLPIMVLIVIVSFIPPFLEWRRAKRHRA